MTWLRAGGAIPLDAEPWLRNLLGHLSSAAQGKTGTFYESSSGRQYRTVVLDKLPDGSTPPGGTTWLLQVLGSAGRGQHWVTLFAVASNGDYFAKGVAHASFDFSGKGMEPQ